MQLQAAPRRTCPTGLRRGGTPRFAANLGAALVAALVLAFGSASSALANGVGDLYGATSAGIVELHVVTSSLVNTVPLAPAPSALAFSPDGRQLYVVADGAHVTPIEIETLEPADPLAMPGDVTALVFPNGTTLVGAIPTHRTLVFIQPSTGTVKETSELPGTGNLLAGDRHDPRVAVAEAGKSWLEIVNPATDDFRKLTVDGEIRGIAIERDRGGVLVATHNPDGVTRIDLTTLAVTWKATLSAVPTGVAALAATNVAVGGTKIWRVASGTSSDWGAAKSEIMSVSVSDEGRVLHAAERDSIEAFGEDGRVVRTLDLAGKGLSAIAAVPAGSSLFTGNNSNAPRPSTGSSTSRPGAASLPPTSTLTDGVEQIVSEPRFQGAAVVAAVLLLLCWFAIRRYDRGQKGRPAR